MAITIRAMQRGEIEKIWTIDRSEVHHHLYCLEEGALRLVPAYFEVPGWDPDQIEADTPRLEACFARGGAFIGAFDAELLVGVVVVDTVPLGSDGNQRQLKYLYVSRGYRQHGIASRLFQEGAAFAKEQGAKFLYISATPTENTVNFYQSRGARLNPTPDSDLYAQEPEDIHLLYGLE